MKSRKYTFQAETMRECSPFKRVEETEREFMDAFKVIIQSGYVLEQADFFALLEILQVSASVKPTMQQRVQIVAFFTTVATWLDFNKDLVEDVLTKPWVE